MICIQLGANIAKRREALRQAELLLSDKVDILHKSDIYETEAWGMKNQASFYNQLLLGKTQLDPFSLLAFAQNIEKEMGRVKNVKWGPRIIDIDIIFFGQKVIYSPHLKIPHAYMAERRFILQPLKDMTAEWEHPLLKQSIEELMRNCIDNSEVKRLTLNVE